MDFKSKALVLHNVKYSDTSLVVTMFTETHGRQSFMVQGVYKKKSRFPPTLFQPLTILNLELSYSNKRELQRIKEATISIPFQSIPFDYKKATVALFLSEILYKSLREEVPNTQMFSFLENSIHFMDTTHEEIANFHLWFLLNLSKFLGFFPMNNYTPNKSIFDAVNGKFYEPALKKPLTEELEYASGLHKILELQITDFHKLPLNHHQRNQLLSGITEYYKIHLGHTGSIKSLPVLQALFEE